MQREILKKYNVELLEKCNLENTVKISNILHGVHGHGFWVNSLRMLVGHDEVSSDRLSKEGWESGTVTKSDILKRKRNGLSIQTELIIMTFDTVLKVLKEEGIMNDEHDVENELYNSTSIPLQPSTVQSVRVDLCQPQQINVSDSKSQGNADADDCMVM